MGKETFECKYCKRILEYNRNKGHRRTICSSCSANVKRFKRKEEMVAYKGGVCEQCGYKACIACLTFHHLDPKYKEFEIAGSHCRSWKVVKKELDKCVMLCNNCHGELHYNEHTLWRKFRSEEIAERLPTRYDKIKALDPKECPQCYRIFRPKYSRQKYCSAECVSNAMKVEYEKICMECGDRFTTNKKNRLFCCRQCHNKYKTYLKDKACIKCGVVFKPLNATQKYCCHRCAQTANRKAKRPTKSKLARLVWEKPTTQLAKEFGVSDKAISKWCKSYDIEKPPRGYWAKRHK